MSDRNQPPDGLPQGVSPLAPSLGGQGQSLSGREPGIWLPPDAILAKISSIATGTAVTDEKNPVEMWGLTGSLTEFDRNLGAGEIGESVVRLSVDEVAKLVEAQAGGRLPQEYIRPDGFGFGDLHWLAPKGPVGSLPLLGFVNREPRSIHEAVGSVEIVRWITNTGQINVMSLRVAGVQRSSGRVIGVTYAAWGAGRQRLVSAVESTVPGHFWRLRWGSVGFSTLLENPYWTAGLVTQEMMVHIGDGRVPTVHVYDSTNTGMGALYQHEDSEIAGVWNARRDDITGRVRVLGRRTRDGEVEFEISVPGRLEKI